MRFGPVAAVCAAVLYSTALFAQSSRNSSTLGIAATNEPFNSAAVDSSEPCSVVTATRIVEWSRALQLANENAPQCKTGGQHQKTSGESKPQVSTSGSEEGAAQGIQELLTSGAPPRIGSSDAPATIVVFGDFECAFCRRVNDLLEGQILTHYKNDVSLVYRFFPLPQHPWARQAAEIAACVQRLSPARFWELNHFLYANQGRFSSTSLRSAVSEFIAKNSDIDTEVFDQCMDEGKTAAQVEADIELGTKLGVHSTPTIFVNGERLFGAYEAKQLEAAISMRLKTKSAATPQQEGKTR